MKITELATPYCDVALWIVRDNDEYNDLIDAVNETERSQFTYYFFPLFDHDDSIIGEFFLVLPRFQISKLQEIDQWVQYNFPGEDVEKVL